MQLDDQEPRADLHPFEDAEFGSLTVHLRHVTRRAVGGIDDLGIVRHPLVQCGGVTDDRLFDCDDVIDIIQSRCSADVRRDLSALEDRYQTSPSHLSSGVDRCDPKTTSDDAYMIAFVSQSLMSVRLAVLIVAVSGESGTLPSYEPITQS